MTGTTRKWLTVEPLVTALTSWARRLIAGADDESADVEPMPIDEDEEIVVGPIQDL